MTCVAGRDAQVVDEPARPREARVGRVREAQHGRLTDAGGEVVLVVEEDRAGGYVAVSRSTVCVPASYEPLVPVMPLPYCAWHAFAFGF